MPRALIVKFGAIGDVLMALPAAQALCKSGYTIDWVCGQAVAPLLALYPWVNPIVGDEEALVHGSLAARLSAILSLWRALAGRSYDLCATLYYDPRYRILSLPIRARRRLVLSHADREFRLIPGRHHTDEYARILLGLPDGERPASLPPVPPPAMPPAPLARTPGRARVILAPGGARNTLRDDALRRWPPEFYAEVARQLLARDLEVVLIGSQADAWVSPHFTSLAGAGSPGHSVTDCIGAFSLVETVGLLHAADVFLTHDTGPLHLAGITSVSIVAVFGPTDPAGRLPQRPGAVALWGGERFACRPCYDGKNYAPCTHNGCVREITPPIVVDAILQALSQARPAQSALPILTHGSVVTA